MIKPWIFEFFGAPGEFHERFDAARSLDYFDAYLDLWAYQRGVTLDFSRPGSRPTMHSSSRQRQVPDECLNVHCVHEPRRRALKMRGLA